MPSGDRYRVQEAGDEKVQAEQHEHEHNQDDDHDHGLLVHRSTYRQTASKLRAAYDHHRNALNVGNLEREQVFSWQYCFFAIFSYTLMLSDVLRTGVAIKSLPYVRLEPDNYEFFGPYVYETYHLTTDNATTTAGSKYWAYKYDTTSVTMRAIAQHLKLPQWSQCLLYKETCDETRGIPFSTVFTMVESMVEGIANHEGPRTNKVPGNQTRGVLALRTESVYKDRTHHYALPWFFDRNIMRTTHAVHAKYNTSQPPPNSCADPIVARRPFSCLHSWTHLVRKSCTKAKALNTPMCQADAPRVWDLIRKRLLHLKHHYPDHAIDFVILDGMEDNTRGGVSFQGHKYYEVVLFSRIQKCDPTTSICTTVAVDDYRYEAAAITMNVTEWYFCVGILRALGQTYAWLRFLMLIAGCCVARMREQRFRDATLVARIIVTVRTVFLIPSQVVIYGSSFPISVYLLAHLIDSPAAYELVANYFTSMLGAVNWSLGDIIQQCAISMRSVWVVGFVCHRIVGLTTSSSWSPIHGIPGTAEFSITFIASLTIFAQFRSISFRQTEVLKISEIIPSARRAERFAATVNQPYTTIRNLISGSTVDAQCLLCGFSGLLCFTMIVWIIKHTFPETMPLHLTLASNTIAPYSAGTLWPRSRLVVSWYGTVLSFERGEGPRVTPGEKEEEPPAKTVSQERRKPTAMESVKQAQRLYRYIVDTPDKALVLRDNNISRLLQRDMYAVDKRSREIESTVFLVNLAAMTDLFTFLDLRVFDGRLVALYQSKATLRCFLLPYGLMTSSVDIPIDWDDLILVAVVNSKDMEWPDLLRCG